MAVKIVSLLLLWDLAFLIQEVTPFCNVTCTTDYKRSLNCSCSDTVPTFPILLEAICREFPEDDVKGSCEIKPPQSWCSMEPENFELNASIGTKCTASVNYHGSPVRTNVSDSTSWDLSDMVKPRQPFKVQVTNKDEFFNITWEIDDYLDECLNYRVRIKENRDFPKDPGDSYLVDQQYLLINHAQLRPRSKYIVDIQASLCPKSILKGPWSEWSSTAEWSSKGSSLEVKGNDTYWWYLSIAGIIFLILMVPCYLHRPFWIKKIQMITYIPKADRFFKPLYCTYEGNFKDWVKPVFSEYDILMISTPVQVMTEKRQEVPPAWSTERETYGEDNEKKQGGRSHECFYPPGAPVLHVHEAGSWHGGTGHSTGHISIHTVTLSGEEESGEEGVSGSSGNTLRSYQDEETFGLYAEGDVECGDFDSGEPQRSRMCRGGGLLAQGENQISAGLSVSSMDCQSSVRVIEPERVSLDSFKSNGQSEDGYPSVDLDTIDSGFGEADCSSPVTSESSTEERIDSAFYSNYVKQWMIGSTLQEDPSA
ncbi:interleukin 21 receptor, tandem duplicate 1 [Polymixia lowei]